MLGAMVIPGVVTVRSYQPAWLPKDLVAGLVLASLLIPQGMAYAELAGLPPITGLYTSIMCLLAYALFGPSRILVLGPDSSLGPMIAATILPLVGAGGDPEKAIALASVLALMVGAITHPRRGGAARVHRRPSVEADPDRLHERPGADDLRRPAAKALRVLDGRERPHQRRRSRSSRESLPATPFRPHSRSVCSASS